MKKHADLSLKDSKQTCKSILEDIIGDIPNKDETSMYSEKPKDPHSDGLDESPLLGDEIDDITKKCKLGVTVAKLIN